VLKVLLEHLPQIKPMPVIKLEHTVLILHGCIFIIVYKKVVADPGHADKIRPAVVADGEPGLQRKRIRKLIIHFVIEGIYAVKFLQ